MSDEATRLIEEAERIGGARWDDETNPNGMFALLGALARAMGNNPHAPKDDVAAGMLLAHRMTPAAQRKRQADALLAEMLVAGLDPETLRDLFTS